MPSARKRQDRRDCGLRQLRKPKDALLGANPTKIHVSNAEQDSYATFWPPQACPSTTCEAFKRGTSEPCAVNPHFDCFDDLEKTYDPRVVVQPFGTMFILDLSRLRHRTEQVRRGKPARLRTWDTLEHT